MPASPACSPLLSKSSKRPLAHPLLAWYRRHRRNLPWRRSADPYQVWISEIMLQQTQVATVVPYFTRFLAAFPSIATLAAADEGDVLRLWEGLGYYRRARQLHHEARIIVQQHDGRFPADAESVGKLPGIGRYTAGAILSIAFDQRAPILEANTVRLFSRLVAFEGDPTGTAGRRLLWQVAEDVLPARNCRDFNQALMELGSQVCTPQAPRCDDCPLTPFCQARLEGRQHAIPAPRPRPITEAVHEAAVVVRRRGRILVRQRSAGERWAGLWDFLRFPLTSHGEDARTREVIDTVRMQAGVTIGQLRRIATIKHGVTRFRITLDCYTAECKSASTRLPAKTWRWLKAAELAELALSTTGRKIARLIVGESS